jgi:UDP-glucose 4-epimerase
MVLRAESGSTVAGRRILLTGVAGFIGSHLAERLLAAGADVIGVDCFTDYYARELKESNLAVARDHERFTFRELDLSQDGAADLALADVDGVVHLAAQAGVRGSFGQGFDAYVRHNVLATQRLLEAAVGQGVDRFVYASSSSVYGTAERFPTPESTEKRPVSPYGITKSAMEDLAAVYHDSHGVPAVGLRYFTVYGPRQRPDMAFSRFFARVMAGEPVPVFGTGEQIRDFTYIDDIVEGTVAALEHGVPGRAYNLGGGTPVRLIEAIELIGEIAGRALRIERRDPPMGEAARTGSDCTLAARELGWEPGHAIAEGLQAQHDWILAHDGARPVLPVGA